MGATRGPLCPLTGVQWTADLLRLCVNVRRRVCAAEVIVTQLVTHLPLARLGDSGDQSTWAGRHGWSDAESACAFWLGSP